MSSAIETIYDRLAAAPVNVIKGGTAHAITGKDVDETPNNATSAACPLRILSVLEPGFEATVSSDDVWMAQSGMGKYGAQWEIFDTLLFAPVGSGPGYRAVGKVLLAYQVDYLDMLSDITRFNIADIADNDVLDVRVRMTNSVIEYPLGTGHEFYGVRATLTVSERICG